MYNNSSCRKLRGQWEERVGAITALEKSVQQVQDQMGQQRSQLLAEKEQQTREMAQQLEAIQVSIQQQLATREAEIREELKAVIIQKEREVAQANEKVVTMNVHTHTLWVMCRDFYFLTTRTSFTLNHFICMWTYCLLMLKNSCCVMTLQIARFVFSHPNTYSVTKCMFEQLHDYCKSCL